MEYYNNILSFEAGWLIDNDIMSLSNYKYHVSAKKLQVIRRACRSTPALVAYDSMPDRFKDAIKEKIKGDPYNQVKYSVLEELITPNNEASHFFETFKLNDGRFIPKQTRITYYNNAIVLDAIHMFIVSKQTKRRAMGGKTTRSWETISEAAQSLDRIKFPHDLPPSPRSLERKYDRYKSKSDDGGYISIIHKNYLKDRANAAKVDDDVKQSLLSELFGDARNLDNAQVARMYNQIAGNLDWKKISTASVAIWRDKLEFIDYAGRRGTKEAYNNKLMQVKRAAPTRPLYFLTLDGWDAELMYQKVQVQKYKDKDGEIKERNVTTYHHRPTVVVVLDPCCKYPIGYAVGTHENPELIKAALRNAAQHTRELFGTMYRAHQLQSDNYAIGAMTPIYEVLGKKVTPARQGNAKAKVIEPYFGHVNKTYCQTQKNWSGFGIQSKKDKQPNAEVLNQDRKDFPDFDGVVNQVSHIMELERQHKRDAYLEAWGKVKEADKIELSQESYLLTFGENTGRKNLMQGSGLNVTIRGIKRVYDSFDIRFRQYASTQWSIIFDPQDTSRILATNDDQSLRFVLEEKYVQPMALKERQDGDAAQLDRVRTFNTQAIEYVTEQRAISGGMVRELFEANPQLDDTLAKLMLTDSRGQHKNNKYIAREQVKTIECQDIEEKSIYDKY